MNRTRTMITIETGTEKLLCHIEDRVGVITLNNPGKRNALGNTLTPALRRALLTLEDDERVGCVMITGAGTAFCSGGDISGMGGGNSGPQKSREERVANLVQGQQELTQRIYELSKITIAALPGPAAGAGLSIALACDLRVASRDAFVMTAFVNVGLSGDYGASWFLSRLIGLSKAKELFYTSERVSATDAAALGLINKVFPEATFRNDALAFARKIANGPTSTLGRIKINLNQGISQSLQKSLLLEAEHMIASGESAEAREAIQSFMEKRKPVFHVQDNSDQG